MAYFVSFKPFLREKRVYNYPPASNFCSHSKGDTRKPVLQCGHKPAQLQETLSACLERSLYASNINLHNYALAQIDISLPLRACNLVQE